MAAAVMIPILRMGALPFAPFSFISSSDADHGKRVLAFLPEKIVIILFSPGSASS